MDEQRRHQRSHRIKRLTALTAEEKKGNPGVITSELCEAYRETLQVEIKAMEKSIKLTVAVVGVLVAVIQIIINFLL